MSGVGSWQWSRGGGTLSRKDRFQLLAQGLALRLARLQRQSQRRLGLSVGRTSGLDPAALVLPDSTAARDAMDEASTLSPPWLLNHCWRTYAWAALLGQARGLRVDAELLFCACLLHDLGLTPAHDGADAQCHCFAVEGARAAHGWGRRQGWAPPRCDRLADAISLHLNPRVGPGRGAEAHLLHAGAALDVVGANATELPRATRLEVEGRYPRLDFAGSMAHAMQDQAARRPGSRAAFLVGLGFTRMIRGA